MRIESRVKLFAIAAAVLMASGLTACSSEPQADAGEARESSNVEGEHAAGGEAREGAEHNEGREGGEHAEAGEYAEEGEHSEGAEHDGSAEGGEGEESGVYIGRGDTWDVTRRGARLVLTFDPSSDAFEGTVENTTESTLCAVRVEVHLSTGTELGPTSRTDVPAGQTIKVELSTDGEIFDSWTAHPEMSACSAE
jgi:hypothetical protein